jgi:hypothetical protein
MSNSWSIVDIQYHCGQDEVAFRYNKFKGVDYWICYRYPDTWHATCRTRGTQRAA